MPAEVGEKQCQDTASTAHTEPGQDGCRRSGSPSATPRPPLRGTRTRPMNVVRPRIPDPSALSFYSANPGVNTWLEVRTGDNITGNAQDKGVFSRCPIPPNTRLAPYLGRVCSHFL
jgi:hypothetical protein